MLTKFRLISLLAVVSFHSGCWDDPNPSAPKREPRNTFTDFQHIGGTVSGVWTKENNPHVITGETYIKDGDSLVIAEGVIIVAEQSLNIGRYSSLIFRGNMNSPIRFVHNNSVIGGGIFSENGVFRAEHAIFEGDGKVISVGFDSRIEWSVFSEIKFELANYHLDKYDSTVIRNCIFAGYRHWNSASGGVQFSTYDKYILDSSKTRIENNLFFTAIGNPVWVLDPDPVVDLQIQGKGEVKRIRGTSYPGNGNVFADPKWVKYEYVGPSPAGISANDYRLQPGSPAIGAAHDGTNIGAY